MSPFGGRARGASSGGDPAESQQAALALQQQTILLPPSQPTAPAAGATQTVDEDMILVTDEQHRFDVDNDNLVLIQESGKLNVWNTLDGQCHLVIYGTLIMRAI